MTSERNNPAPAGPGPTAVGSLQLSCNEAEALCRKAARGVGYSWGLAEEAGFAARWLHARRINGLGALLTHLDKEAGEASDVELARNMFRANDGGHLCPIAIGAGLSDYAAFNRKPIRTGLLDQPLLVLPFLHQIAYALDHSMTLTWVGGEVMASAAGHGTGNLPDLVDAEMAGIVAAPSHPALFLGIIYDSAKNQMARLGCAK